MLQFCVIALSFSLAFARLATDPVCGTTPYNADKMICCKDILRDKPSSMSTCCGSEAMDMNTQICCDSTINLLTSKTSECCGSMAYDINTHNCINGQIVENAEKGCPSKYNSYKHICCNGHVYNRDSATMACCGSLAYDSHTHECCDGVVAAKHHESHGGCCGRQVYNSDSHICCSGVLQKRGMGVSVCCGTNLQDAATQICCNGRIQDKHEENALGCCHYNSFTTEDHYCCGTTVHKLQKDGFSGCCGDLSLNSEKYECADGKIVQKFAQNYGVCGQLSFNTEKQICCMGMDGDVLHPRSSPQMTCCGSNSVDNQNTCCLRGEVRLCGDGCMCAAI